MRECPGNREGREPAAKKQNRTQTGNRDHAGVFGDEEHGELHARVFRVEARNEFGLSLRQVERHAICFRDGRGEETEKADDLREDIPAHQALAGLRLLLDDAAQD